MIQVGHRGGTPTRSKAYHSFGYFNLRDYGLADKKSAIEQLAARHPFIDINRVGIYGHSGGGFMTAAAMLQKPYNEFFKVGVSSSGNHDNNIYGANWAETYHGLREVAVTTESKTRPPTSPERAGETQTDGQGRSADDQSLDSNERRRPRLHHQRGRRDRRTAPGRRKKKDKKTTTRRTRTKKESKS